MVKPRVLILGGTGSIGRNFIHFLLTNKLASSIRVADKKAYFMAFFSHAHEAAITDKIVEFVPADLSNDEHLDKVFDQKGGKFNVVFNLAAETKLGQVAERYTATPVLAEKCAKRAMAQGAAKFVHISTAHVYKADKKPRKEDDKLEPWTVVAQAHAEAEAKLRSIEGCPLVILRPATVYGAGDHRGIMPRVVCAASYWKTKEKMQFLWGKELCVNTVHVTDVCRAMWHCAAKAKKGSVYNLADQTGTNQGILNEILSEIFGIETGFHGKLLSNLARVKLDTLVNDANEGHLGPWLELTKEYKIHNTPLSPFIDKELLRNNHLSIDGTKITELGFAYSKPKLTKELLMEAIADFTAQGVFPPIVPGMKFKVPKPAAPKPEATVGGGGGGGGGASA